MKTLHALTMFATATAFAAGPAPVVFNSFTYTGRDTVFDQPLPAGSYRNPILAGYYPDPSICRVGDDYYLVNSTFAHFPGIPIHHSRDLVHWTQIGQVVSRPTQLNYDGLGVSRGLFAPAISYHQGTFYMICTMIDAGGNFFMTATNPAGPWSDPVWLDFDGIDPSFFFDHDGKAWLVNNGAPEGKPLYNGHRAIWVQEFDAATQKLVGPRSVLVNGGVDIAKQPVWIEGPHLYRRGDWYYLCCAEGGTGDNHSQVIFRSKSVTGPFVPWDKNPILTQRDLDGTQPQAVTTTGHADMTIGPDGQWWAVFLACRPYAGHYFNTGRETFLLPVKWTDDSWPVILPPGERVPYVVPAPVVNNKSNQAILPEHAEATEKTGKTNSKSSILSVTSCKNDSGFLTGNFTWGDEFDGPALSPLWIMLRQPHETWWSLTAYPGHLSLTPRRETLSGKDNPSFLARRLQHARFEATTALTPPATPGVSAGLAAFQNETHHYFFGVRRAAAGLEIFLERLNGKLPEIVATATIPDTARLELRLTGEDKILAFAYATEAGKWQTLVPDADATVLSTQTAGGFVGAILGLHARLDQ